MTHNNPTGVAKDAADQNFDYMFKLLIIGNSSVGKTSFVSEGIFFRMIIEKDFHSSSFDMQMIHLHQHLLVLLELILRLKLFFDMINVLNYKFGIPLVKNVIERLRVNELNVVFVFDFVCLAAYYRGAMGFILMYDITNEESFNAVQDW